MNSGYLVRTIALGGTLCLAVSAGCSSSERTPSAAGAGQASDGTAAGAGAGTPASSMGGAAGSSVNGGTGGVVLPPGTSSAPKTIQCGGDCTSARVGLVYVDPCCGGENSAICGVDTSYLRMTGAMLNQGCEPKQQPGEPNDVCPSPPPSMIDAMGTAVPLDAFRGCCRPNGTCGVEVNTVTAGGGLVPVAELDLGCVDTASFFPGMAPVPCSDATGGVGGASGAGGAASAGGAP